MATSEIVRKLLLLPLSHVYGWGVGMRNKLFDWGLLKEEKFDIPIIAVGNLAVGGTGKTPHTEFIADLLRDDYNIGILSRGYKRHTKGFVLATPHTTPRDIGDESYQMYHKFGRNLMVAVCENRVEGIRKMREINPDLNLIILDDGFQHRYVKPKVSVLLTEYNRPYYKDHLMPYGRLRESAQGVTRADIVIVTKCPDSIKAIDYRLAKKHLDLIPDQDLFFSRYNYEVPRPVFPNKKKAVQPPILEEMSDEYMILAICGIGNPKPFLRYVRSYAPRVKINLFPDHHDYTRKDMELLQHRFDSMPIGRRYILTTEKDAVRLINNPYFPHQLKPYIFYIPVRVSFDEIDGTDIRKSLARFIRE